MGREFTPLLLLLLCAGCPFLSPGGDKTDPGRVSDLDRRYEAIVARIGPYEGGGRVVLDVAHRVLREGRAEGRWPLVGLEDLWAEAIKEGAVLFNRPDRRWGATTADETADMLGQNTIGPWQITIRNVRSIYGRPYGVQPDWSDARVCAFCRENPEVQARMIADYIQEAYEQYGRRGPYGIQRYFSLKGFVRGDIGRGAWDRSVLPAARESKADTGFYAKQVLLGTPANPHGLLYWLWVTGDAEAIREVLRAWRDQCRLLWDDGLQRPLRTNVNGRFAIRLEDLKYLADFPDCRAEVERLVNEVLAEREPAHENHRIVPAGGGRPERRIVDLESRLDP